MKIRWELYERLKIFSLELYPGWFYLVGCGMVLVGNYWPGIIPLTTLSVIQRNRGVCIHNQAMK